MFANRDKAVSGDAMRATASFTILVAPGLDQILAKCNETYEQAADHGPASRCALRGSMSHQDFTAGFFGALFRPRVSYFVVGSAQTAILMQKNSCQVAFDLSRCFF